MIDLDFLKSLIRALDASGLDSVELERGGTRIRLLKTPEASAAVTSSTNQVAAPTPALPATPASNQPSPIDVSAESESTPTASDLIEIKSPMVGTFYRAPAPDALPYADVGDRVSPGDTLCIIEAMKLMNDLESEVSGVIQEICVENADPVEFGQVLFRLSPP